MKYPAKVEIFKKEFRKNEGSSLWIKPSAGDLCYYPHIPEKVKSAVRNNFGISVDEEILFVRDTSFWNTRDQGLVITDYAIKCIPDNDNIKDFIFIPWNLIDHVEYESFCLYFYGEERDDNLPINLDFFTKDMPNAVKRVCGKKLASVLTNIAKTQEYLEDGIDDDMPEWEKLEKEGNRDEARRSLLKARDEIKTTFIKHPETVKAFTSSLYELGLDLYGHVYPNISNAVASLARRNFFLEKDETILYVNLNKEKDAGIVITDCRFLKLLDYEYRPLFWNWSEITIEYGSNGNIDFVKLDGTTCISDGRSYWSNISAEEFGPEKEKVEKSSFFGFDNLKDLAIEGAQVAGVAILDQSFGGKVVLKVIESSMESYSEKKYNKEKAIWEREQEEKLKIQKEKNEPYFKLFSKMIESQVRINYEKQNEERNVSQEEFEDLFKAAEQGDAEAQFKVGECYYYGDGVEENMEEAIKWYRKAAEQGYIDAQNTLGLNYYIGDGVEENNEEAFKWYKMAAEQGDAEAQNQLGTFYNYGTGVEENVEEAIKWYLKAAEQGNLGAQYNLGKCYYNGKGVAKNYAEAFKWYSKAAEQGDAEAQNELGDCYYLGRGVKKDIEKAGFWYSKAAKQREEDAKLLEELRDTKIDSQQKSNEKEAVSKSNRLEADLLPSSDLLAEALGALHGNWMKAILVTFIYMILNVVFNYTLLYNEQLLIVLLSYILLANPIFYGYRVYALDLCREEVGRVGALFDGFRDYKRVVLTLILKDIYILLWSLLLVVPGLVKSYSYAMTVFIMNDHPEMAYNEAIEESMAMMDGHKKKLFLLDLSFIGWILLCVLSFGILLIFVNPYMSVAHATFYENLKEQKYVH